MCHGIYMAHPTVNHFKLKCAQQRHAIEKIDQYHEMNSEK